MVANKVADASSETAMRTNVTKSKAPIHVYVERQAESEKSAARK